MNISRKTIIIFWISVITIILGVYFFMPEIFYRVTQVPYQKTPYVNTPNTNP